MIKFAKTFFLLILMFSYYGCATESEEVFKRPSGPPPASGVYLESDRIVAFFEVTNINEYKKLIPSIFSMPERPLCMVAVRDFYKMESGGIPYIKAMTDILVKYKESKSEKEILAWYCLEMPVTSEWALWYGRTRWGERKVLRKVTFERYENKYVGTSYARDGKTVGLKLMLELKKREFTPDVKSFLDFVSPIPTLSIKDDKVFKWPTVGGDKYKIYELEKIYPQIWNIKFGDCSIEYPNDPKNYLHRLGVGNPIIGFWAKMRHRFEVKPMQ
jgi:hypothetical protein